MFDINWRAVRNRKRKAVWSPRVAFQHLICNVTEGTAGGRQSALCQWECDGRTEKTLTRNLPCYFKSLWYRVTGLLPLTWPPRLTKPHKSSSPTAKHHLTKAMPRTGSHLFHAWRNLHARVWAIWQGTDLAPSHKAPQMRNTPCTDHMLRYFDRHVFGQGQGTWRGRTWNLSWWKSPAQKGQEWRDPLSSRTAEAAKTLNSHQVSYNNCFMFLNVAEKDKVEMSEGIP